MAKTTPGEFIRQVRVEAGKVVWPTGKETWVTADHGLHPDLAARALLLRRGQRFAAIVQFLLGLLA
jgi:preprotein translocase subunit SecE